MKPLVLIILLATSTLGYGQTQAPKKEFAITLSQDKIQLSPNETREVQITISRSRSYLKSSAVMGLSSSLPKGIEVSFSPDKGTFETTTLQIVTNETVVPGSYSLVVKATLNGKTKGSIIKLNVTDKAIASDGNK